MELRIPCLDSSVDLTLSPVTEEEGSSLAIEPYFIRTDGNGNSYCMVAGEVGLLEKRIIRIGAASWGTVTIESGLTTTARVRIVNAVGITMASFMLEPGATVTTQLVPGVYIVAGKKVAVR